MPHLVAAPDKFRSTATARQAAEAIAEAASEVGWTAATCPMSDGGEGFVDVLGGATRVAAVRGPLGEPTTATWSLAADGTAFLESAAAIGRALLATPRGDDPVRATTHGVGDLVVAALSAGATRMVVGCGGSATTDGGRGCVEALDELGVVLTVPLVVACDVTTLFADAPSRFGPQKGATPAQVRQLEHRLAAVAVSYRERFGVDVATVVGGGAAGGLAGALVALGGTTVPGAAYVADAVGLPALLRDADLVVTGEGQLDEGTLDGKVVTTVLAASPGLPAVVVAGRALDDAATSLRASRRGPVEVVELDGASQRRLGTPGAISDAVRVLLAGRG